MKFFVSPGIKYIVTIASRSNRPVVENRIRGMNHNEIISPCWFARRNDGVLSCAAMQILRNSNSNYLSIIEWNNLP